MLGRSTTISKQPVAGLAGRADEWAANDNARGAANRVAVSRRRSPGAILSLTHQFQPPSDKAAGTVPATVRRSACTKQKKKQQTTHKKKKKTKKNGGGDHRPGILVRGTRSRNAGALL